MIQRITLPLLLVVEVMLNEPDTEHYGYALSKETGLAPGTVQPILTRLEDEKLVEARWEDIDPHVEGRRPRRLYRINGAAAAVQLSRLQAQHRLRLKPMLRPQPGQAFT